jgi:hypothetical protein
MSHAVVLETKMPMRVVAYVALTAVETAMVLALASWTLKWFA